MEFGYGSIDPFDTSNISQGFTSKSNHVNFRTDGGKFNINKDNINVDQHRENETEAHKDGFFRWAIGSIFGLRNVKGETSEIRALKWTHFASFIFFIFSAIALAVLVGMSEFDVKTDYTTSFITDEQSPRPSNDKLNEIGTVKIGWFVVAIFMYDAFVHFIILKFITSKSAMGYQYRAEMLGKYNDAGIFWRYLGLSFMVIPLANVIGVTDVFVNMFLFFCVFSIGIKFHHEIPRLASDSINFFRSIFHSEKAKDRDMTDKRASIKKEELTVLSDADGNATVAHEGGYVYPVQSFTNSFRNFLGFKSSGNVSSQVGSTVDDFIRNFFSGIYTHMWAFVAWCIFFSVMMCYFVSALHSDSSTFGWWIYLGFVVYILLVTFSFIYAYSYWRGFELKRNSSLTNSNLDHHDDQNEFNFHNYLFWQFIAYTVLEGIVGWFIIAGANDEYGVLY